MSQMTGCNVKGDTSTEHYCQLYSSPLLYCVFQLSLLIMWPAASLFREKTLLIPLHATYTAPKGRQTKLMNSW